MQPRRRALLVALLVGAATLAGCAGDASEGDEPLTSGATRGSPTTTSPAAGGDASPVSPPPKVKSANERWHFHDYWHGKPTITLLDANVTFNATVAPDGTPALGAQVAFPDGVVVPPETGFLTLNLTWASGLGGLVNVSFRPADSNDFHPAGDAASGTAVHVETTESMCDVPHRQVSLWRFFLAAHPQTDPAGVPGPDAHLTITATIGRPLFIDPPHVNWWLGTDVVPLVEGWSGAIAAGRTPAANLSLPALGNEPTEAKPPEARSVVVPVDAGRIVPEGAKSVVLVVNWTSKVPNAALLAEWRESNYPSGGAMEVAREGDGTRVFVLPVRPAMTDTTYSNRTTWEFHLVPEGGEAAAFEGEVHAVAWATRLDPAAAVALLLGA